MHRTALLAAALVGLLAPAVAAHADEAAQLDRFARRMFATAAPVTAGHACFARTYDAAHLARHRGQTVSAIKMMVRAEKLPEDGNLAYSYALRVKFRDRPGDYVATFQCGQARPSDVKAEGIRIYCHEGCEDGGVEIGLAPGALVVKIEAIVFQLADKPNDADAELDFRGGAEDRAFVLDRVDKANCDSLVPPRDEAAAPPK